MIQFDSDFLIQFDSHFSNVYFWFESEHPSTIIVNPQGVPHWIECPGKFKSEIVEYSKMLKTHIAFGKEKYIFRKRRKDKQGNGNKIFISTVVVIANYPYQQIQVLLFIISEEG